MSRVVAGLLTFDPPIPFVLFQYSHRLSLYQTQIDPLHFPISLSHPQSLAVGKEELLCDNQWQFFSCDVTNRWNVKMNVYVSGLKSGRSSPTYAYWTWVAEVPVLNGHAVPAPDVAILHRVLLLPPRVYVSWNPLLAHVSWAGRWRLMG